MRGVALAAALAAAAVGAAVAGGAPSDYRNPTAGRELSLQIPGMHRANVRRGLVHRRVARQALRMDVCRPRGAGGRLLPAVLVGGPPAFRAMKRPDPSVRCNVSFYGPLDLSQPDLPISRRFAAECSAITYLRRDRARIAPMLRLAVRSTAAASARRPKPLRLGHRCVTPAERRRVVRFSAADATRLIGVLFGAGPRAVVLAHQGGPTPPNLCSWVPYARQLAAAGYRVLASDHRRFGSSGSPRREAYFTRVDLDVLAAVRELRRRGATSVVLAGASLGGSAVIGAGASARPPVQGVVSFAAPRLFGRVNALAAARRLSVPVLFVSAVEDEPFAGDARLMYDASPSTDKRIAIFPGAVHGAPMLRDPAVRAVVDGWLAAHSLQ